MDKYLFKLNNKDINPFLSNVPFLYLWKCQETKVFGCFQGV